MKSYNTMLADERPEYKAGLPSATKGLTIQEKDPKHKFCFRSDLSILYQAVL